MPKRPPLPDELPEPSDLDDGSCYEVPAELEEDAPPPKRKRSATPEPDPDPELDGDPDTLDSAELMSVRRGPPPAAWKAALIAAAVLAVGGGLLWYRAAHRARAVRLALVEAEALLRLDTAAAYRTAADKLEIPAQLDPIAAGSARALALALLACDYGEAAAGASADELLVAPERAELVPDHASLARAALALSRNAVGDASNAASRVRGSDLWAHALQARIAMAADRLSAATEPAAAAAGDGGFVAGLAVNGDVARRARRDPAAARAAYAAALAAAGEHGASPRATFGLAKLALAGQMPAADAVAALERLLADVRVPPPERGRAALHLASLRLRAGDGGGAQAALDVAALDPAARLWADRAARTAALRRGVYRAPEGAPASLTSRTDDDPPEAEPPPPPPPPEPRAEPRPPARAGKATRAGAAKVGARPLAKAPARRTATHAAPARKAAIAPKKKATAKPAAKPAARTTAKPRTASHR
jgi:hypothetical protein